MSTQESLPAGNRKSRTTRGITCPNITYLGGYLILAGKVPHPDLAGGYPIPASPSQLAGYPILTWPGGTTSWGTPFDWGTPCKDCGTLPTPGKRPRASYWGTPPPQRTWDQWKYYGMERTSGSIMEWSWGTPPG